MVAQFAQHKFCSVVRLKKNFCDFCLFIVDMKFWVVGGKIIHEKHSLKLVKAQLKANEQTFCIHIWIQSTHNPLINHLNVEAALKRLWGFYGFRVPK